MNNYPNANYNNSNDHEQKSNGSNSTRIPMSGVPMAMPPGVPVPFGVPLAPQMMLPPPFYQTGAPVPVNQPMNPDTTGYFGNLSPVVSEDVFTAVLGCCGGFKRHKRPVDPSNGKFKPFAFVEFEEQADLIRAFGLFQDFPLDNRHLNIKIEGITVPSSVPIEEQLKCYEGIRRVLVGKRVTGGGTMDWLEKKISGLNETRRESSGSQVRRDSRQNQRNYSDLLETSNSNEPQFTKTVSMNSSQLAAALKDRERRWEGRVKEFERDLRKDLEKDEERTRRHEKEAAELSDFINKFSDESGSGTSSLFFSDREKWRKMRQKAAEKETEIFEEALRIRQEISVKSQREFIEKVLPLEREELFAFPVRWEKFTGAVCEEFKEICRERTTALFPSSPPDLSAHLGEIIFTQIQGTRTLNPMTVAMEPTFLAVSNDSSESEMLTIIIWRWLLYITNK